MDKGEKRKASSKITDLRESLNKREILFSNPIVHIFTVLLVFFILILFLVAVSGKRTVYFQSIGRMNFWTLISFFAFFAIINHFSWRSLVSIRLLVMLPISKARIISHIVLITLFATLLLLIILFFVFWGQSGLSHFPSGFILTCALYLLSLSMLGYCLKLLCNPQDAYAITLVLLIISFITIQNHNIRETYSFYLFFIIILLSLFIISFVWLYRLLIYSSLPYRRKRKELGE
jgi:hypothetical protein